MKTTLQFCAVVALIFAGAGAQAMAIFQPGDAILGGKLYGSTFETGSSGGGDNQWPGNEGPEHLIDGVGQKYLNFGKELSGAIITSSAGASIATSLKMWTANDETPRDPAGLFLYGTNAAIDPLANDLSMFDLITLPLFTLPDSRNAGGAAPLDDANSYTYGFSNSDAYTSYLVIFDLLKDSGAANSMQLAEFQLFGELTALPEPGTLALLMIGLAGLGLSRRKKHA